MISYTSSLDGITPSDFSGFFVGWHHPPSPSKHLEILQGSSHVILAKDGERVIGFITAISDGVLSAYFPLLEVLPEYQGRGVGSELVQRMLAELDHLYMIDLCCDESMRGFYEKLGMKSVTGMIKRNHERQAGNSG
jgi:ribosomal protein S18 acetylase RimI-like enzyme